MLKFSTKHCPKKMHIMFLSVVVLFGTVLRFWNLGQWSFWIDEVFTVRDAQNLSFDSLRVIPNPIPYLSVKLSISIAGSREWGSRLIPCLVGVASIPMVFGFGRAPLQLADWTPEQCLCGMLKLAPVLGTKCALSGLYLFLWCSDGVVILCCP